MSYKRLYVRAILLSLSVLTIAACGLFDYSHIPNEWKKLAKAACKQRGHKKDLNLSEQTNFQVCVSQKVSDLKKNYKAQRKTDHQLTPNIGLNFGLVFSL